MNPRLKFAVGRLLACVGVLLFAAHPARAIIAIPTTTYEFAANCVDCATHAGTSDYIVHGQLVLTDAYVLGTTILPTEFVSFTYDGSNLYHSFTIDSEDLLRIFGALPAKLPGPPAVDIVITSKYPFGAPGNNTFQINANGTWFLGQPTDFGNEASFAVPEPSTWAMLLAGFSALGFAGYRGARKGGAIAA
jgi:hypothetical protein